jgi:ribosomal subunit interface protein
MPTVALMTSVSAAVTAPRACSSRAASGSKLAFHQRCKTETHAIRFASRRSSRVEIGRANGDARCKSAGTNRVSLSVEASASTKVIVQGRHLEITDSIREYAEEKINKAVAHFDQHDVREVDVRCSSRGGADKKTPGGALQKTEVTVYTKNGIIRSEEEADDLYASIDAVSDKLERKLRKVKEKKISKRPKHNKNAPKAQTDAIVAEMAAADEALADESMDYTEIVREKFHTVRKCTVSAAAEEMENLGHTFFAFKNVNQGNEVNVVYKRDAGGYGVIVPVDMAGDSVDAA